MLLSPSCADCCLNQILLPFSCTRVSNPNSLSLSLHLPKEKAKEKKRQSKGPTKTHTEKHVFPKQAPRDGLDETVNPFSLSLSLSIHQSFNLFVNGVSSLSVPDSGSSLSFVFRRMMSDYKVEMINDGMQEFYVQFHGPNDSEFPFPLSFFFFFFFALVLLMKLDSLLL